MKRLSTNLLFTICILGQLFIWLVETITYPGFFVNHLLMDARLLSDILFIGSYAMVVINIFVFKQLWHKKILLVFLSSFAIIGKFLLIINQQLVSLTNINEILYLVFHLDAGVIEALLSRQITYLIITLVLYYYELFTIVSLLFTRLSKVMIPTFKYFKVLLLLFFIDNNSSQHKHLLNYWDGIYFLGSFILFWRLQEVIHTTRTFSSFGVVLISYAVYGALMKPRKPKIIFLLSSIIVWGAMAFMLSAKLFFSDALLPSLSQF